jgi:hypothetical protein
VTHTKQLIHRKARLPHRVLTTGKDRCADERHSLLRMAANHHDLNEVTVFAEEQNPTNEPRGCKLTIRIQLHRLAPIVQRFEFVYVCLRLYQMEWNLQAHKTRYAANKEGAVGCFRIP